MRQYCDIPKDKGLDNTINILKEGYLFIPNRMNLFNSNIFETHIMAQKAICITGKDAAKVFYNEDLFKRKGVAPKRIQKTLFGENAIQGKDGIAHIKRKSLFMNILTEEYEEKVDRLVKEELIKSIDKWEQMEEVILFREISQIICYVVCNCVGIYISREASKKRTEDFLRMIYSFSSVGSKYRKGKEARKETEKWIENIVVNLRNNKIEVEKDSPIYKIAFYKDVDNKLLDSKIAAIEIINIIRPIIAVSTYVVFAALALHTHPECREKLIKKEDNYYEMFAQEVRRFYPFTPFVAAKTKKDFRWGKYEFEKGRLVLLDVYGTNHDSEVWHEPYKFRPERFKERNEDLFDFIPQGGGNPDITHRCPGEGVTVKIMESVLDFLINDIDFKVRNQDLSYNLKQIPTLPKSGFIISNVKRKYSN